MDNKAFSEDRNLPGEAFCVALVVMADPIYLCGLGLCVHTDPLVHRKCIGNFISGVFVLCSPHPVWIGAQSYES